MPHRKVRDPSAKEPALQLPGAPSPEVELDSSTGTPKKKGLSLFGVQFGKKWDWTLPSLLYRHEVTVEYKEICGVLHPLVWMKRQERLRRHLRVHHFVVDIWLVFSLERNEISVISTFTQPVKIYLSTYRKAFMELRQIYSADDLRPERRKDTRERERRDQGIRTDFVESAFFCWIRR